MAKKISFTIHYLEKAVVDLSEKDKVAIYDAQNGGHGISIPIDRFLKIVDAVKKEIEKKGNLK